MVGFRSGRRWEEDLPQSAAVFYRTVIRPLLYLLPAETAHRVAFGLLRCALCFRGVRSLVRRLTGADDARLRTNALGTCFPNPVGLAAGFDKDAVGYEALGALGFGFVEVGTLTALPQPGNPTPRLFRLVEDKALINRLGFNNRGSAEAARHLTRRKVCVGVNIGKSKVVPESEAAADYVTSAQRLAGCADYVVVNVSSPNTPGLRNLQAVEKLAPLLRAVREALDRASSARRVPLLVKIAPDLPDDDIDAVADLALELELDGIIATNTTIARTGLLSSEASIATCGQGGLSGAPLAARSLEVLRRLRRRVSDRVILVSVGGLHDPEDAWGRIRAGATLVQLYTGFVYEGPSLPRRINRGLVDRAARDGFDRVQDAVGVDAPASSHGGRRSGEGPCLHPQDEEASGP